MPNEMRDRLVELIYEARKEWDVYFNDCLLKGKPRSKTLNEFIAVYLIENSVIVPPCKIGDTVYEVIAYKNKANGNRIDGHIRPCVVKSIHLSDRYSKKDEPYITLGAGGNYLHGAYIKRVSIDEFGKSIFPSEEQAEQKLKEVRGETDA